MSEATHQTVERDQDDISERTETIDSVGDALTQSVNTFGRLTKAVVDGLTDVTVTSIDVFTDVASGRTRGSHRDTSDRRRTSAGRAAQGWADFVSDSVDIITDGMSRSARSVQRAADRFAGESEKKSRPSVVDAEKDSSAARNVKKS
jgi:hypothetical protein